MIDEITEIKYELEYFNFENNPIIKLYYPLNVEFKSYPETLIELTFTNDYNYSLGNLSTNLTILRFGHKFNQSIDNLPTKLTHLYLGIYFNQTINSLPNSLTHLEFDIKYYHCF